MILSTVVLLNSVVTSLQYSSLPDIPDAKVRPEAVHLHGTNDMSTRDVFSYFQLYAPRNIEWVNDHSCE